MTHKLGFVICCLTIVFGLSVACSKDNSSKSHDASNARSDANDEKLDANSEAAPNGNARSDADDEKLDANSEAALICTSAACSKDSGSESHNASNTRADASDEKLDANSEAAPNCTRKELRALVDDYFEALAAHDATSLPIASDVKFTENAKTIEVGEGLWQKAGNVRFKRSAFDTERCGTHTQAVLDEDGSPIIFGVRLQLADKKITEIETYIVHKGDYFLFDPDALTQSDGTSEDAWSEVKWEDLVPEEQRSTRDELNHIADLYFESFGPAGYVAPMRHDCYRWEDGVRTTGGDCVIGLPAEGTGAGGVTHRRYPIADVEAGIAIGYVLFLNAIDFHMVKIVNGEIRLIQAVITGTSSGYTSTGWEEKE
jgi:hypothetical protein